MARLFFGVSIPARARESLEDLAEGVPEARWVPEDNFHVTLSFLGEVPERQVQEIGDAARAVRSDPFSLQLQSVGIFPRRPPARVLWAGVRHEPRLLLLQKRLEKELFEIGFQPEKRKYHPHVTLARVGKDAPREAVSDWLAQHLGFSEEPFPVARFQLYSSEPSPGGSEYQVLCQYPIRR